MGFGECHRHEKLVGSCWKFFVARVMRILGNNYVRIVAKLVRGGIPGNLGILVLPPFLPKI
jgi:hypothetical protein